MYAYVSQYGNTINGGIFGVEYFRMTCWYPKIYSKNFPTKMLNRRYMVDACDQTPDYMYIHLNGIGLLHITLMDIHLRHYSHVQKDTCPYAMRPQMHAGLHSSFVVVKL